MLKQNFFWLDFESCDCDLWPTFSLYASPSICTVLRSTCPFRPFLPSFFFFFRQHLLQKHQQQHNRKSRATKAPPTRYGKGTADRRGGGGKKKRIKKYPKTLIFESILHNYQVEIITNMFNKHSKGCQVGANQISLLRK